MFYFIHPIKQQRYCASSRKRCGSAKPDIYPRIEGMVRDPMLDTAFRDLEGLRTTDAGAEKMLMWPIYTVYATMKTTFSRLKTKSINFGVKTVYFKPALFQQKKFKSVIPLARPFECAPKTKL